MEANNLTQDCLDELPSATQIFSGFSPNHEFILLAPIIPCFMTLAMFVINLNAVIKSGRKETKGNIATLLTIYPVRLLDKLHKKSQWFNQLIS